MESAFPRGGGRYEVVTESDEQITQSLIDECVRRGWHKMASLYGVTRQGGKLRPRPDGCEIPCGYGTIKGKSWRAVPPVVKGRPISPHTRHVMKRLSNLIARAYHTVLVHINTEPHIVRMFTTEEYKVRLAQGFARVTRTLRALTGDPRAIPGFVHEMADIAEMYTGLAVRTMNEA